MVHLSLLATYFATFSIQISEERATTELIVDLHIIGLLQDMLWFVT